MGSLAPATETEREEWRSFDEGEEGEVEREGGEGREEEDLGLPHVDVGRGHRVDVALALLIAVVLALREGEVLVIDVREIDIVRERGREKEGEKMNMEGVNEAETARDEEAVNDVTGVAIDIEVIAREGRQERGRGGGKRGKRGRRVDLLWGRTLLMTLLPL